MSYIESAQKRQVRTDETGESGYTGSKPSGPVRKNTTSEAFATPNVKRGFVMPKISGWERLHALAQMVWGVVGAIRKDARTASDVFLTTTFHPTCVRTLTMVFCDPEGNQTMPAITQRTVAPTPSTQDAIPASNLHAVLAAFNASNMASSYIERGNFAAARRKLTQALSAINTLQAEA